LSEFVADYDFVLPEDLIASRPLEERDASRMLVLHRRSGKIEHRRFRDLPDYLEPDDLAVLNNSRVIKARLFSDDHRFELLLVEPLGPHEWLCLVKPGRKMRPGFAFAIAGATARVKAITSDGSRIVEFDRSPDIERFGRIPIPPYLGREADDSDEVR
jgi:S-adenosylmethionine:tRNA ribosyltransferase-isomerase